MFVSCTVIRGCGDYKGSGRSKGSCSGETATLTELPAANGREFRTERYGPSQKPSRRVGRQGPVRG